MSTFALRGPSLHALAFSISIGFLPCVIFAASPASSASRSGIAWQVASSDAEVNKAFAISKKSGKPVFLYWGAVWCPPCNQVKATLFSRADFVERSRAFVPVYVDGDRPGAQKVAARFKVQGYPTMIIFRPDGTEITRLPGEVDPQRYLLTMTAGMNAEIPVKELVRKAEARQPLTREQWQLLAFYSWDTDEQQVLAINDLPKKLGSLAAAAPIDQSFVRDRLAAKAVVASAQVKGAGDGSATEAERKLLDQLITDPLILRQLSDILIAYSEILVKYAVPPCDARDLLTTRWEKSLGLLAQDPSLSRADQLDLLDTRIGLWKIIDGTEKLAAARQPSVLKEIARVVGATTDRYERQAVVPSAAHVLTSAGLLSQSDELLRQELRRAVAPYYHMLGLARNAKSRNDSKSALYWYEQAWRKSEGPATRIQWGVGYVTQLVDLTPADTSRIEIASSAVIAELSPSNETFYERNERSLKKMASQLAQWRGADQSRIALVGKLIIQLEKICSRLPAKDTGRINCQAVASTLKI